MNAYEKAWRALDESIEGQVAELRRRCDETAAEIQRDAPRANSGGSAKMIAARATYLVELQARLVDHESLLARMRSAIQPAAEIAS